MPLLGLEARRAHLRLRTGGSVWQRGAPLLDDGQGLLGCKAVVGADGEDALELAVGAGAFEFVLEKSE